MDGGNISETCDISGNSESMIEEALSEKLRGKSCYNIVNGDKYIGIPSLIRERSPTE